MKIHLSILCIFFAVLSSEAAEFDLGTHGTLSINVPDDWSINGKAMNRPDGTPLGYVFAIQPQNDARAKCLLTFTYVTTGAPNQDAIRKEVLRITEEFVSQSVEKKQNLKDFSLGSGFGSYCLFTDASLVGKKPMPDDYKVMGSGQVLPAENVLGVVSLFADEADGVEMTTMVKIINSLKVCLAGALTASAAGPRVDEVFSQNDVQDIRQFMASITADQIEAIDPSTADEHVAGAIPKKAIHIARDGTETPITYYVRADVARVLTSDENHVLTEYKVRKGPQGWALEIQRFGWFDYPVQCLFYLFLGGILHFLFFGLGCICLIVVQRYARTGYRALLWRWGQFNIALLLVATAVAGLWSCLIFGHFYTSSDYLFDFTPFFPITQSVIDERFGNEVGHLYGITLGQLQLIWLAFAAITWALALSIYFLIRRRGPSRPESPSQPLQPCVGSSDA